MTATKTGFVGFEAHSSKHPYWVINEGELADGTPAWKVKTGVLGPYYTTWLDDAMKRDVIYCGQIGWIAKHKLIRGRAR